MKNVNIVDEICELRTVNKFLLGDEDWGQIDGTILSIDFKDAFRSISLRWFNLVLQRLAVPQDFIDWFWAMYSDLHIVIVVNLYIGGRFILKKIKILGHVDKHCKKSMFNMKFWDLPRKNLEKIYT